MTLPRPSGPDVDAWTGDDPRMERIYAAFQYVPLNLYDEVTKLAEHAVGDLIREHVALARSAAGMEGALRSGVRLMERDFPDLARWEAACFRWKQKALRALAVRSREQQEPQA